MRQLLKNTILIISIIGFSVYSQKSAHPSLVDAKKHTETTKFMLLKLDGYSSKQTSVIRKSANETTNIILKSINAAKLSFNVPNLGMYKLSIYNPKGQRLFSKGLLTSKNSVINCNLKRNLSKGIYIIRITGKDALLQKAVKIK